MLFQIGLKGFSGFHNIRHDLVHIFSLIHYFDFYFQHVYFFYFNKTTIVSGDEDLSN